MVSQMNMIKKINTGIKKLQNKREKIISKIQNKCEHPENSIREQQSRRVEGDGYYSIDSYIPSRRICLECGKFECGDKYIELVGDNIPFVSESDFRRIIDEKRRLYYG